jgi:3-phosphoshikimate 1-carboxyvinyltransferase
MGADLTITQDESASRPEPVGGIVARSSPLRGTEIAGDLLVRCLDEVPVLAVLAALAEGETWMRDASELRAKESDRIESVAAMLRALGAEVETTRDSIRIQGQESLAGGTVEARGDHRIAMSAVVAGCAARGPVTIDDVRSIATSDPTFLDRMVQLGAPLD